MSIVRALFFGLHFTRPLGVPNLAGPDRQRGAFESFIVSLFAGVALMSAGCQKQQAPVPPGIVATVGDAVISEDSFRAELERRAKNGHILATPADRDAVLKDMIRLETFFARAQAQGLHRDPELMQQFKRTVASKFEDAEWKKNASASKPDAGELELYYRSHQDQFTSPEKVHVAILFLRVPVKAGADHVQKAEQQAADLRRRALEEAGDQPDFGLLAQENSDDQATRYQGGDCGWITRQAPKFRWDASLLDALFALQKPGEITPLIRVPYGVYIGKLIERKAPETAPFPSVRDRIEQTLMAASQKQARERFENDQRSGLKIEINESLLKSIDAPRALAKSSDSAPPAMPTP